MGTQELCKFLDDLIDVAYKKVLFTKESVQHVLQLTENIKGKLIEGENLATANLELNTKVEFLESENLKLKKWFDDLGVDLAELNKKIDVNEINVPENSIEEILNHSPKIKN